MNYHNYNLDHIIVTNWLYNEFCKSIYYVFDKEFYRDHILSEIIC